MQENMLITCPELLNNQFHEPYLVELERYRILHPYKKRPISESFKKAQEMRDCEGEEYFMAFFHLWTAFNGWASCITGTDQDAAYIDGLKRDIRLCQNFTAFTTDNKSPLPLASTQFASFWPIFSVKSLRRSNIRMRHEVSREEAIGRYLRDNTLAFAPRCAKRHKNEGQSLPIDWPHTLTALYQVRCNLFHGGKVLSSEEDQQILASAYKTLLFFLEEGRYLEQYDWNIYAPDNR